MGGAVRVVGGGGQQPASVAQVGADGAVGRIELIVDYRSLAAEPFPVLAVLAVRLDREHRVDAVGLAQFKIVLAMVGRHVDQAGAAVGGDEVAGQEGARPGEEAPEMVHGVADGRAGKLRSLYMPDWLKVNKAAPLLEGADERLGDQDMRSFTG